MLNILKIYDTYKSIIQYGGMGAIIALIYYGILQSFITNVMLFFYLTYKSIKMLETSETLEIEDLLKLLKRWVCYSCYVITTRFLDLSFTILPFVLLYNISKMLLFLWMIKSEDNVFTIYDTLVIPFFENYQEMLDGLQTVLEQLVELYKTRVGEFIKNNYINVKSFIFSYIKDLIRENIVKKEDVENMLKDLNKTNDEETPEEKKDA